MKFKDIVMPIFESILIIAFVTICILYAEVLNHGSMNKIDRVQNIVREELSKPSSSEALTDSELIQELMKEVNTLRQGYYDIFVITGGNAKDLQTEIKE